MSSIAATRSGRRTADAFEQYVSGFRAMLTGAVFFLETTDRLAQVRRIARRGDGIIVAGVFDRDAGGPDTVGASTIGYEGSWRTAGDVITLDGCLTFELQDYSAIPFLTIVGRTVVRVSRAEGFAAFLCDADTARHSGIFVNQLLDGDVLVDSRASFVPPEPQHGSLIRAHVTVEGEYRDGPDGILLGHAGDARRDIEAAAMAGASRGGSFARIIDRDVFEAELDQRPWFERYLAALEVLREWGAAPARPMISGFGGHLVTGLDAHDAVHAIVSPAAPFLVTGDGAAYVLVTPDSRHRLRLDADEARAAECLIATGDEEEASELLGAEQGLPPGSVSGAVSELRRRFLDAGVDLAASAQARVAGRSA